VNRIRRVAGRVARAVVAAVQGYFAHLGPQLSAAIAYHVLLSLFPLLILLLGVFGLVLQDDQTKEDVTNWLLDSLPLSAEGEAEIEAAVEGIATPASAAGIVSLLGLAWAASGAMAAVRKSLDLVWETPRPRPVGAAKLFDLLLVLGAGLLVLLSFGLTVVIEVVADRIDLGAFDSVVSAAGEFTRLALPFVLTFATFVLLYARVPAQPRPLRLVWPGALVAAVAFEALKIGFAVYLASFARYNIIYGSLGAVIAFLVFAYLAATVFLIGGELSAAWPRSREVGEQDEKKDGEGGSLWVQARRLVRGLFVHDLPEASEEPREQRNREAP
jgi:membrane protein